MKNLTAILLLLALALAVAVDADQFRKLPDDPKGSFNLSVSLDPGFTFGRGRSKHRSHGRGDEHDDDNSDDWPNPAEINHFDIPEEFTEGGSDGNNHNHTEPSRHHGNRHRSRHHS